MQQIPLVGSLNVAGYVQTALATSKLRLFISTYAPSPTETLAEVVAAEATFSGYTAGGYPLATFGAPTNGPIGGASTPSPQIDVAYVPPESDPVSNTLGGWFIVDTGGNLIADGTFNAPIPMTQLGNGFPITIALVAGTQNAVVQCWVNGLLQN